MASKWKGHKRLRRQADLDWDFQGGKIVVGLSYVGPYAACLSGRPDYGSELADMAGYRVTNTKVRRQSAGIGRLSVTAECEAPPVPQASNNDATSTQLEKEWSQVEKPLKQHPMYGGGGAKEISTGGWTTLARWEDEQDSDAKAALKYRQKPESTMLIALGLNEAHIASKLLKGRDSYLLYQPILRKTTNHPREPDTGDCATTGAPTGFKTIPKRKESDGTLVDYVWVKTADRATNSGEHNTWQRMQEWTGFDEVDADLYPAG